jgi:hypothetical protein
MYIKLIAKPDYYYDSGTEVFNYDGERYTEEDWNKCLKVGCCGVRGDYKGKEDGEWSICEEFKYFLVEENKHYKGSK